MPKINKLKRLGNEQYIYDKKAEKQVKKYPVGFCNTHA
ncbi:hypothetical protein CPS_3693 [Colwellia psychrerythraea 34H]|uniref:Uncharacterized protein n=1 Tax=Colwellia psychrerythraea (strain 34H / ATCC BAA-681) TaxID=167879 RepID=Q47XV9_COLP3|nr:hypothetical protein CPS_3693 [Colwellia psychrerythraea 34H]